MRPPVNSHPSPVAASTMQPGTPAQSAAGTSRKPRGPSNSSPSGRAQIGIGKFHVRPRKDRSRSGSLASEVLPGTLAGVLGAARIAGDPDLRRLDRLFPPHTTPRRDVRSRCGVHPSSARNARQTYGISFAYAYPGPARTHRSPCPSRGDPRPGPRLHAREPASPDEPCRRGGLGRRRWRLSEAICAIS
jgi:hypothetical protein